MHPRAESPEPGPATVPTLDAMHPRPEPSHDPAVPVAPEPVAADLHSGGRHGPGAPLQLRAPGRGDGEAPADRRAGPLQPHLQLRDQGQGLGQQSRLLRRVRQERVRQPGLSVL